MGTILRRALMPALTIALAGLCPADVLTVGGTVTGSLASDDTRTSQGKYEDQHTLTLAAGQGAVVLLVSEDFDCYLKITGTTEGVREDDDSAGDLDSRLMVMPAGGGTYSVTVTTYGPEEVGSYTLSASPVQSAALMPNQLERGLFLGSPVVHRLPVTPGQALMVFASSEQFDTTLEVQGPDGLRLFNDDIHGMLHSGLLYTPGAEGEAALTVDAYSAGSSGEYEIIATDLVPMHHFNCTAGAGAVERVRMPLPQLGVALFELAGEAGAQVRVDVASEDFDTVVYAFGPEGEIGFDDDGGDETNSRLIVTVPETGLARLVVAPFEVGTTGRFEITADAATSQELE